MRKHRPQRHRFDAVTQREARRPVDDVERVEFGRRAPRAWRWAPARRRARADALRAGQHQQIEFRALVRSPEIAVGPGQARPAPGEASSSPRVRVRERWRSHAHQRVQQPGVAEIDLRRFHLALAQVLVPGLQLAHHQGLGQRIEIAPHGRLGDAERARRIGGVPGLPVVMRQHAPEAQHCRGGDVDAKLRQVDLDMAGDGARAPCQAVIVRCGQPGARKAAAQPQPLHGTGVAGASRLGDFREIETAHLDLDPANSDSPAWRADACRAAPCPGASERSISTRSKGNSFGRRCTSSITTRPLKPDKVSSGCSRRASCSGFSRSK